MRNLIVIIILVLILSIPAFTGDTREEIPPIAVRHFLNGLMAEFEGDIEKALSSYLIALNFIPENPELHRSIADIYLQMNRPENALEAYLNLVEIEPKNEHYRRYAAEAAFTSRNYSEAEKQMSWVIDKGTPGYGDWMQYVLILMSMGNSKDALKSIQKTAELYPTEPGVQGMRGNIHLDREEYDKAIEAFRRALEIDAAYSRAYMGLSAAYEMLDMTDSLIAVQEKFISLNPDNTQLRRQWLNLLIIEGKFERALDEGDAYLEAVPTDWEMLRRLAFLAYYSDRYEKSIDYFRRLLDWDASDREARLFYARSLLASDLPEQAIEQIEIALAHSKDPDGIITLALAYESAELVDEAIDVLRRGEAEFSDAPSIPIYRGVIYGRAGKYSEAINSYGRALIIDPGNEEAIFGLADVYERSGQRVEAIELLRDLWDDNRKDPLVANYLGYLLVEENIELEFAGGLIELALEKDPENAAYIDSYGWYLYRIGEYEEALEFLLRADSLAQTPDPVILEHTGVVYEKLGKNELAVTYYNKALELDPDLEHLRERLLELE